MIYIFSWGGGVNSTAMLAMIKLGMLPELNKDNCHIVFADTGAEMPYTYEHTSACLQPMIKEGWTCKVIRPCDHPEWCYFKELTLEQVCLTKGWLPSARSRWCSTHFKVTPIKKYRESLGIETALILGISSDEKHRARELGSEHTLYPLIEENIDRAGCIELIKKAGLPEARKSGCYMCPMQRKAQFIDLYKNYREYFDKAVAMEKSNKKGFTFLKGYTLEAKMKKWLKNEDCDQGELFDQFRHCLCEL